jgi:PIN domain nuclease of toxin-antitoxin system
LDLLLDTHAFIWWLSGDGRLSRKARAALAADVNGIFVSAASAWEIATKYRIGKLDGVAAVVVDVAGAISSQGFSALPIGVQHGQLAGSLPGGHRDPFDRMLIAQALLENLLLVSNDSVFDGFGVHRYW